MPLKVESKVVKRTVSKRAPKSIPVKSEKTEKSARPSKVEKSVKVEKVRPSKVEKSVKVEKVRPVVKSEVCPITVEKVEVSSVLDGGFRTDVSKGSFKVPPVSSKKSLEKEELAEWFDNYLAIIEHEIELTKDSKNRDVSIQVFKNLLKYGKKLKATSVKVMKTPRKNTNSGFQKEKEITPEMAKFAGWNVSESKSRNDIYKALIKYIKDNNLQNPFNRREIRVDSKLSKLLAYDSAKRPPLTFSSLQSEIGKLFKQD